MNQLKPKINKFAILSILSFVLVIMVALLLMPEAEIVEVNEKLITAYGLIILFSLITFILSIISIKQIKKTKEKGKIVSIIFSIIGIAMTIFFMPAMLALVPMLSTEYNDEVVCPEVKECVKFDEDTSKCLYKLNGVTSKVSCSTSKLKTEQLSK